MVCAQNPLSIYSKASSGKWLAFKYIELYFKLFKIELKLSGIVVQNYILLFKKFIKKSKLLRKRSAPVFVIMNS